ncbi:HEAT repeat domain-containing protein [Synechococcales cyanobacterium C]|uniref:HEAT repeat domain-containing protein n=1 Tax=Petrachloros mirabilis ULC683 TaxID=2781853 RepID=A0A8K2A7H9_9CYAN|nr:HEAT repeat domain-containing protein [Petrachloros mirabilis]NCJ06921.1 HEAT repeat domain-containing protein [Petrachloros mirabilis ULC683]
MPINPESVQQALASEDFGERLSAVNQIRTLPPDIGFKLLKGATSDTSARVRYAAVSQMSVLGEQDREAALTLLRDRLRHDSEVDVQSAAADALCALHLHEAFPDLRDLYYQTSEWLIKFSIISSLGELGHTQAFEVLQDALSSEYELVRTAAIGALGDLGDHRAVPLLAPFVSHEDWQVRYRLAQALSALKTAESTSLLQQLARDSVAQVAEIASLGLSSPA